MFFEYGDDGIVDYYKENGIVVIKNAVSSDLQTYLTRAISLIDKSNDLRSGVRPDVHGYPHYKEAHGHIITETLLDMLTSVHEKCIGKHLVPTYSFIRRYSQGNNMINHIDRPACQHSITIQLCSSDDEYEWPLYVRTLKGENIEVEVNDFDLIMYQGENIVHGRDYCLKEWSYHTFLHYVDADDKKYEPYYYDKRPRLYSPK